MMKDLARLNADAVESAISKADRLRFFLSYLKCNRNLTGDIRSYLVMINFLTEKHLKRHQERKKIGKKRKDRLIL